MAMEGPEKEEPNNRDAWLRINHLVFAPHRIHALLEAYNGDPAALFAADRADWIVRLPQMNEKRLQHLAAARDLDLTEDYAALEKTGAALVTIQDAAYPANLRQLPDAPPVLLLRGELLPEDKFSLAIVGSRRATSYGLGLARQFARDLTSHGLTIVSGGARGVDSLAHRGALDGGGRTLAFLGCGVDVDYPRDNQGLFREIADGRGAVLSEFPMKTEPEPWRFPARNRLISGSSLGVLVIESPSDSGSLITAREAGDQGREVFAIPGPIGFGHNAGCHKLIQDGAKLVESVEDILGELGILTMGRPDAALLLPASPPLPPEQKRILDLLTLQPRQVEGMIQESGLTVPQVTGILTLLEMRGLARRVPGNAFVRVL
jgi:DNA processing protein